MPIFTIFHHFCPAMQPSNFNCNFSKPVAPKLLIKQIWEKEFFMKIDIFGIFWLKNGKNCPCTKLFILIFTHFFNKSKSVENEKVQFSQMIKVCRKNFQLSKEKINFWPFLWFFQNHKNSQKIIFSFEMWNFFWHTIIIWGNSTFSFWTLFMRISQIWCNPLRAHHFLPIFCL